MEDGRCRWEYVCACSAPTYTTLPTWHGVHQSPFDGRPASAGSSSLWRDSMDAARLPCTDVPSCRLIISTSLQYLCTQRVHPTRRLG